MLRRLFRQEGEPPQRAAVLRIKDEVIGKRGGCIESMSMKMLRIVDATFEKRWGYSGELFVPFVPTFPLPIAVVYHQWPAALRAKVSLTVFEQLARSHYAFFAVHGIGGDMCVGLQPEVHSFAAFGEADAQFVAYAEEQLDHLRRVTDALSHDFVSMRYVAKISKLSVKFLQRHSDVFEISCDGQQIRLRRELMRMHEFLAKEPPTMDEVNELLKLAALHIPSYFVHMHDVTVPTYDATALMLNPLLAHAVELDFPWVRLRPAFQHPLKGSCDSSMRLSDGVRLRKDVVKQRSIACVHDCFYFSPRLVPDPPGAPMIHLNPADSEVAGLIAGHRMVGVCVQYCRRTSCPAQLVVSTPLWSMIFSVGTRRYDKNSPLASLLSSKDITKIGINMSRATAMLGDHSNLTMRQWVDSRDLLLFSGFPVRPGGVAKSMSAVSLIRDVAGDRLWQPDYERSDWAAVVLRGEQVEYLSRKAQRLSFVGLELLHRALDSGTSIEPIMERQECLTNHQLVAVNATLRLRRLTGSTYPMLPHPCRRSDARRLLKDLREALMQHPVEYNLSTLSMVAAADCSASGAPNAEPMSIDHSPVCPSTLGMPHVPKSPLTTVTATDTIPCAQSAEAVSPGREDGGHSEDIAQLQAEFDLFEESGPEPIAVTAEKGLDESLEGRYRALAHAMGSAGVKATATPKSDTHGLPADVPSTLKHHASNEHEVGCSPIQMEYVSPQLTDLPPPPKPFPGLALPPSTRGVHRKKKGAHSPFPSVVAEDFANQVPPPTAHVQPEPAPVRQLPDDLRRQIAEAWLQEQINSHVPKNAH